MKDETTIRKDIAKKMSALVAQKEISAAFKKAGAVDSDRLKPGQSGRTSQLSEEPNLNIQGESNLKCEDSRETETNVG